MGNAFGDHVRHRREELGMTQREVAEECGVCPEAIGLIEAGQRHPQLDRVPKLAVALELHPAALCRLALETQSPCFYAELVGEPLIDAAGGYDPEDLVTIEVTREDAVWVKQYRALDSLTRHHLAELAATLVREKANRR